MGALQDRANSASSAATGVTEVSQLRPAKKSRAIPNRRLTNPANPP